ncbi:MAG: sensor histidine kinase [Saccharospirillum sp.]
MKNSLDINTLLAATVHDVKNSLSLIDDQIQSVIEDIADTSPQGAQKLSRIRLEAGRINNGLVHMLGLYRLNSETFIPNFEEVLVEDVIRDATSRYTETLASLGVRLTVEQDDPDLIWFMDPVLVEGILANALTNSIRYTTDHLIFSVGERDGGLSIRITDNGAGYPERMMNFMGQGGDQGDISFQHGSTGLGLYFCYQTARLHKNGEREGFIELSNDPDSGGAVFELWLP